MPKHTVTGRTRLLRSALAAALVAALPLAGTALAKGTLVYCSEGSPEGFQPQFFSTGTTFDAVSVPMFNRLVEFEIGTTNIVPALAESWTISPDGKVVTFKLRQGVKFHSNANFKPTRDFNADDVLFSWTRMADDSNPFHKITAGQTFAYFEDMGMKNIVDKVEKVDDYTVQVHAEAARGAVPRRHGDGLRVDPVEGVLRGDDEEGHAERRRHLPDRHRAVRVRLLPEGRDDPLQGLRPALPRQAEGRQRWSTRSPATRRRATPS